MRTEAGNDIIFDVPREQWRDWRENPFQLVSLMEILRMRPEAFCKLVDKISRMLAFASPPDGTREENIKEALSTFLPDLLKPAVVEARKLGFSSTESQLRRMLETIEKFPWGSDEMLYDFRALRDRMIDDLESRFFLAVPFGRVKYYDPEEPLFGPDVANKFPSASYDIAEAGKCYALGRSTACVFHLMRVLEPALTSLATAVGTDGKRENWNTILEDIERKIRERNPRGKSEQEMKDEQFNMEAAVHFRMIKNAWRNYVAHAHEKYTTEEAGEIFTTVRAFMTHLSTRLSESSAASNAP